MNNEKFQCLSDIKLHNRLGEGSTGTVYSAYYKNQKVAVKIGKRTSVFEKEIVNVYLFHDKCKELGKYYELQNHDTCYYLPKPYVFEQNEKDICLVMDFKQGKTLEDLLKLYPEGLKEAEAETLAIKILNVLSVFHQGKDAYVYRDLKPSNVIVGPEGEVYFVDLGAVTKEGEEGEYVAGTYGFSAPEQFWPEAKMECSSDIYSFGKILYFMLTGKNPGEPPYIEERFIEKDGRVPAKYREFLKKCLNSNPGERFPNASVCLQTFMELPNKKHKKNKEKIVYKKSIWVSNYSIHIH